MLLAAASTYACQQERRTQPIAPRAIGVPLAAGTTSTSNTSPLSQPTSANDIGWRPIGTWSGRGSSQTESFGSDGTLRFRWTAKSSSAADSQLRVTLRSAVSGRPLSVPIDHHGDGQDTAYASETPRDFYVEVEANHAEWTVSVDERVNTR